MRRRVTARTRKNHAISLWIVSREFVARLFRGGRFRAFGEISGSLDLLMINMQTASASKRHLCSAEHKSETFPWSFLT